MNKSLKHDLHQLKLFCAENGFETFRAKCWNLFNGNFLPFNCIENCQDQGFDKCWISYNYEQLAP